MEDFEFQIKEAQLKKNFKKLRALHALDGLSLEDLVEVLEILLYIFKSEIKR